MIVKRVVNKDGAVAIMIGLDDYEIIKLRHHTLAQLDVRPYDLGIASIMLVYGPTDEAIMNAIDPKRQPAIINTKPN
jgi:hypothetical protein